MFDTPERPTSPWARPVIETAENPPLPMDIAFPLVEILILLFRNVLVFVWPVPPFATATARSTFPKLSKPALALIIPSCAFATDWVPTALVFADVFADVTSALFCTPERPTSPWARPVIETFEYPPPLAIVIALLSVEIPILLFKNLPVFVSPVPPFVVGTAKSTIPLRSNPARILDLIFPASVNVFMVGLPVPVPSTLILPSVFIWTFVFRIDPLPVTGSVPTFKLPKAVREEEENTPTSAKPPSSILIRQSPSTAPSWTSILLGLPPVKTFPLPTKSFSSISLRISCEDLSSALPSPTSAFTWTWTTGVSQVYKKVAPDPIWPLNADLPLDDQSLLPSFGFVGILSLHPVGIPLLTLGLVVFDIAGWEEEYLNT